MNGDEMSRGMNQQTRRSNPPNKYNDKPSYSPSTAFGPKNNSNHSYNSYSGNSANYNGQQGQNQRRRPPENRFKTGGGGSGHHSNSSDRIVKQNDIIIRLLKEIRDRLPAPPAGSVNATDLEYLEQDRNVSGDTTDQNSDLDIGDDNDEDEEMDSADGLESNECCDSQECSSEKE
jgi:hypothetical protein